MLLIKKEIRFCFIWAKLFLNLKRADRVVLVVPAAPTRSHRAERSQNKSRSIEIVVWFHVMLLLGMVNVNRIKESIN